MLLGLIIVRCVAVLLRISSLLWRHHSHLSLHEFSTLWRKAFLSCYERLYLIEVLRSCDGITVIVPCTAVPHGGSSSMRWHRPCDTTVLKTPSLSSCYARLHLIKHLRHCDDIVFVTESLTPCCPLYAPLVLKVARAEVLEDDVR